MDIKQELVHLGQLCIALAEKVEQEQELAKKKTLVEIIIRLTACIGNL